MAVGLEPVDSRRELSPGEPSVEDGYVVPSAMQKLDQVKAYKSAPAQNECVHERPVRRPDHRAAVSAC